MRGNAELARWGRETLADARAVFVGSAHIREVLEAVVGHVDRVYEVPPGVDVETFRPELRPAALRKLLEEAVRDQPNPENANERLPDEGNAERLDAFLAEEAPTVLYFGKLIRNKGVHLLLQALERVDARAVIVGFGDYREELERQAAGLDALFTGPFEHRHLVHLLALADVAAAPSIFPEAFGMVAAEAAACGVFPVSAAHSGLAEVTRALAAEVPEQARPWLDFEVGDGAVRDLASSLISWLQAPEDVREATRAGIVEVVREKYSWEGLARTVVA
ncbi:MAG: glycosyltransferase, partial [Thermoleophilia bacterium]